jgi:uncharacterized damage-inducible protein DinB
MPTKTKAKARKQTSKKTAKRPSPAAKKVVKRALVAKKAAAPKSAAPSPSAASTDALQRSLANVKQFFDRTLSIFDESDAAYTPAPGMFSTAQQVAHAAQTFDWFLEGAFRPEGFGMDFPALEQKVREVTTLERAKAWLEEAYGRVVAALKERSPGEWSKPIAKETLMGGAPRSSIVDGLVDHTAHHRGSLQVYARLRGKTPLMPYGG